MILSRYYTLPGNAKDLLDTVRRYIPPGSAILEPFAGQFALVRQGPEYHWTTNDIVPYPGLDYVGSYDNIPVKKYDAIVTNPPFCVENLFEILAFLKQYSDHIFIILPCCMGRLANLESLAKMDFSISEIGPCHKEFWSEDEGKIKCVRCIKMYLRHNPDCKKKFFLESEDVVITYKDPDWCICTKSVPGMLVDETFDKPYVGIKFLRNRDIYYDNYGEIYDLMFQYGKYFYSVLKNFNKKEILHFFQLFKLKHSSLFSNEEGRDDDHGSSTRGKRDSEEERSNSNSKGETKVKKAFPKIQDHEVGEFFKKEEIKGDDL
jgi:hypothetical protein